MILLGIDYGEQNIGLAIASGPLAEPLKTIKTTPEIYDHLYEICKRLGVSKIIIGISEGTIADRTKTFAKKLENRTQIQTDFQDETLTSKLVAKKLRESGAKKKKRRQPDHKFAATIILQDYLDQHS